MVPTGYPMPTGTPRIMVADDSALVAGVIEWHSQSLGWDVAAVDDEKMTIRWLELGADHFWQKPVNTRELEARARVHLVRRGATIPR